MTLFSALIEALAEAVDSYLGLSITMVTGGRSISMTTLDSIAASDIATTATLVLGSVIVVEPGSVIVVYAARPGAFTDLAADLTHALALRPQDLVLDDFPTRWDESARLRHQIHLNQGVGILIERGHLPDDAHAELGRRADRAAATTEAVALQLITESARLAGTPSRGQRRLDRGQR
ncbi:MAG: hypothetical protein M3Y42_02955 [Actinomycetota bacterium]|nr:hypothetical protein [Actinomycetota bacterium]